MSRYWMSLIFASSFASIILPAPALANPCCPSPCGHITIDLGLQYIQPYFQNNPALYFLNARRNAITEAFFVVSDVQRQQDVGHHMDFAPEGEIGYVWPCGLGIKTRAWYFDQDTHVTANAPSVSTTDLSLSFPISSAAPIGLDIDTRDNDLPDSITVETELETFVWDGLVTQNISFCHTNLALGGGVRYVHMDQDYDAHESQAPGPTLDIRVDPPVPQVIDQHRKDLVSNQKFSGAGPIVQVEIKRAIGCTNFSILGNVRGSTVFGTGKQTATKNLLVRGTQAGETLSETAFVQRSNDRNALIGIIETELGVEYGHVCNSNFYGQLLFVGQEWLGGGSASRSATTGAGFGLPGSGMTGAPQVAGVVSESNFGFIGAALRIGY